MISLYSVGGILYLVIGAVCGYLFLHLDPNTWEMERTEMWSMDYVMAGLCILLWPLVVPIIALMAGSAELMKRVDEFLKDYWI